MKICFVSMCSYPLLVNKNFGTAGGAEIQLVTLAKQLVSNGYKVCFVTYDYGQKTIVKNVDGIEIIPSYSVYGSKVSPILKFLKVISALQKTNADIFVCSPDSHGILPVYSFFKRKKFIYRIPSDAVVLSNNKNNFIRLIEFLDLKRANVVVAQTDFQKKKLKENFNVQSIVIRNSFPISNFMTETSKTGVLWVGSLSKVKQPQLFVSLAKKFPDVTFNMVGGASNDLFFYKKILNLVKNQDNLIFHGFVPFTEIKNFFEKSLLLVNTSSFEGFPNTFLQAWENLTPVLSLNVDPDGIIIKNNLGLVSGSFEKLITDLRFLLENEGILSKLGFNCRKYVEEKHNIINSTQKYMELLKFLE